MCPRASSSESPGNSSSTSSTTSGRDDAAPAGSSPPQAGEGGPQGEQGAAREEGGGSFRQGEGHIWRRVAESAGAGGYGDVSEMNQPQVMLRERVTSARGDAGQLRSAPVSPRPSIGSPGCDHAPPRARGRARNGPPRGSRRGVPQAPAPWVGLARSSAISEHSALRCQYRWRRCRPTCDQETRPSIAPVGTPGPPPHARGGVRMCPPGCRLARPPTACPLPSPASSTSRCSPSRRRRPSPPRRAARTRAGSWRPAEDNPAPPPSTETEASPTTPTETEAAGRASGPRRRGVRQAGAVHARAAGRRR